MKVGITRKLEKMTDELQKMKKAVFVPDVIIISYEPEQQNYIIREDSLKGKSREKTVNRLDEYIIIAEYDGTVLIDLMGAEDGNLYCFNAAEIRKKAGIQGAFSLEYVKGNPEELNSEFTIYPYE